MNNHASKCALQLFATAICGSIALGVPETARACEPKTVYVFWGVELQDAYAGDYLTGEELTPARGVRVTVIRPYPEPAIDFFLDENGAGSFDSQFTSGHRIVVHAEAVLGFGTDAQIHLKVFEPAANIVEIVEDFGDGNDLDDPEAPFWVGEVLEPGNSFSLIVPNADSQLVSVLAAATEVIYRLHHELPGSILSDAGTRKLGIGLHPTESNAFAGTNGIFLGTNATGLKFIVGHEIGHWLQRQLAGNWELDYNYGPDPSGTQLDPFDEVEGNPHDSACRFAVDPWNPLDDSGVNPNRHGIRSAEFSSGAMPEGFGHFVAAAAFNAHSEDGVFRYYKTVNTDLVPEYAAFKAAGGEVSLAGGNDPEPETLGGESRWVETQCSEDWDHPLQSGSEGQEVTSEIDWLRFFWQFWTSGNVIIPPPPSFWDTVQLVTYTQLHHAWQAEDGDNHALWPNMHESAEDLFPEYVERFEELTVDNGVFNEP